MSESERSALFFIQGLERQSRNSYSYIYLHVHIKHCLRRAELQNGLVHAMSKLEQTCFHSLACKYSD